MSWEIKNGDSLEVLKGFPENSIESIVTDPPYGLSFMGKKWDYDVPGVALWEECLRVIKPGGHLLAFAGTRTQHRMAVNIEDAGWEIRDCLGWLYGSGFPKSLDVSKALDKAAGAKREIIGKRVYGDGHIQNSTILSRPIGTFECAQDDRLETAPATEEAKRWSGWGTALKPAWEPIIMARKPLSGTVAANVIEHGVGGINVDGCRVGEEGGTKKCKPTKRPSVSAYGNGLNGGAPIPIDAGRWPSNILHDGSDDAEAVLGEARRFFYCPKASKADRGDGNSHPTVKPTELMQYLVRLVTPPGGIVLDPFCGSGTTGVACIREGFRVVLIEREIEYCEIAKKRLEAEI